MRDPYVVLGLRHGAVLTEVKASYRRLAKIYHPDLAGGSTEKFQELSDAYEVLLKRVDDRPPVVPTVRNGSSDHTFYRILNQETVRKNFGSINVDFPDDIIPARSRFIFMLGYEEFSVFFDVARSLPFTIGVKLLKITFYKSFEKNA
jgi:hypothetical protein